MNCPNFISANQRKTLHSSKLLVYEVAEVFMEEHEGRKSSKTFMAKSADFGDGKFPQIIDP